VVGGGKDTELDEGRAGVADRPGPGITGVVTLGTTGCGVSGADEDGGVGGKSWVIFWLCNIISKWNLQEIKIKGVLVSTDTVRSTV
jgi:hypothetical protein